MTYRLVLPVHQLAPGAPERGPLLMLATGLEIAARAIELEHPRLKIGPLPLSPPPTATELLAEMLITRFDELSDLIARYNAAVDDALGILDDDDPPF